MPHEHKTVLCNYHNADEALVAQAIDGALAAKLDWENTPFNDRAAIFLKAADLASTKYRYVNDPFILSTFLERLYSIHNYIPPPHIHCHTMPPLHPSL